MSTASTNLVLRNDTILGVCEAIGQDFGFHPNWLRLTLAGLFYWFPFQVIGAYLLMGLFVAVARYAAPAPAAADQTAAPTLATTTEPSEQREKDFAIAA